MSAGINMKQHSDFNYCFVIGGSYSNFNNRGSSSQFSQGGKWKSNQQRPKSDPYKGSAWKYRM